MTDSDAIERAVSYAIARLEATPLAAEPFAHVYVRDIFPADFYDLLRARLPRREEYIALNATGRVSGNYSAERLVFGPDERQLARLDDERAAFWRSFFAALLGQAFARTVMSRFEMPIRARFAEDGGPPAGGLNVTWESFLVRDGATYALKPHTDSPKKLVSVLFYLAPDDAHPELGTSLYAPRARGFTCAGGPHHGFELFEHIRTMHYLPNTLFAFPKSRRCFHGVEPVTEPGGRDLLFYDLRNEGA